MSNQGLFTQANHTLTLIGQKNPTQEHLRQLHDGLLSDLVDAIMTGTMPDRGTFCTSIGLPSLQPAPEPEVVIDPIVRVDRSVRPSYPNWVKTVMHPELENVGPSEYDVSKDEQWLHDGQKDGKWTKGDNIYAHLKETGDIKNHYTLRDLEEIQKKGVAFFRKYFAGKVVFAWGSVVLGRGDGGHYSYSGYYVSGGYHVPYLDEFGGKVVIRWLWFGLGWRNCSPGLRHAS